MNRMTLATDHVADRRESIQQAREAREERERHQRQRKASVRLVRSMRKYCASQTLQRLAVARIRSLLDSNSHEVQQDHLCAALRCSVVLKARYVTQTAQLLLSSFRTLDVTALPLEVLVSLSTPLLRILTATLSLCATNNEETALDDPIGEGEAWNKIQFVMNKAATQAPSIALTWQKFLIGAVTSHGRHTRWKQECEGLLIESVAASRAMPHSDVVPFLLTTQLRGHSATATAHGGNEELDDGSVVVSILLDSKTPLRSVARKSSVVQADVANLLTEAERLSLDAVPRESVEIALAKIAALLPLVSVRVNSEVACRYCGVLSRLLELSLQRWQEDSTSVTPWLNNPIVGSMYQCDSGIQLLADALECAAPAIETVCRCIALPLTAGWLSGEEGARVAVVPWLYKIVMLKPQALLALWRLFTASSTGWLNMQTPQLAVSATVRGVPWLFLHLFAYFMECGELVAQLDNVTEATVTEGDVRQLVRLLRDVVVKAHQFGCTSVEAELIATRCCYLLGKLYALDEARGFAASSDWLSPVRSAQVTHEQWNAALDEEVRDSTALDGSNISSAVQTASRQTLLRKLSQRNVFDDSLNWDQTKRLVRLLRNAPFVVPFEARVRIFGRLISISGERGSDFPSYREEAVLVKREHVFEDAFAKMGNFSSTELRSGLRVGFKDEAGLGPGVFRDFILSLCKQGFAPEHGLFRKSDDGNLYPNPLSFEATNDSRHLQKLRFLGAMVGKALRDGILLDVPFAAHFRNALLGRRNTLDNLKSFDAQLHQSLIAFKHMDEESLTSCGMYFTATMDIYGAAKEVDLVPGGRAIAVTKQNVSLYILRLADFRLNRENELQIKAFQGGLYDVVEASVLQLFGCNELEMLFQGTDGTVGLDVDDWERNTEYQQPTTRDDPRVSYFWHAIRTMSPEEQRQVLAFVTSTRRAPILGFQHMTPKFTIAMSGKGPEFLPSAGTCFCLLKLPTYSSMEETKKKLLVAIEHGKTFELS